MTDIHRVDFFERMPTGSSTANLKPQENPVTQDHTMPAGIDRASLAELPSDWREQVHDVFDNRAYSYETARALIVDLVAHWHIATARKFGLIEEQQ